MGAYDELDSWAAYTSASLQNETLAGDPNSSLLGMEFDKSLWTTPQLLPRLDTSYMPFQDSRHFSNSTLSSDYSQASPNLFSTPQSATSDDFSAFQSPIEPTLSSLPFSMSTFGQILNEQNGFRNSPGNMSSNSSVASGTEYPASEYLTAKEKSLLHRRKQNRAAQRTFRQRKEVERIELQARLDTAVQTSTTLKATCDELNESIEGLRQKVKLLEEENKVLRIRFRDPGSCSSNTVEDGISSRTE